MPIVSAPRRPAPDVVDRPAPERAGGRPFLVAVTGGLDAGSAEDARRHLASAHTRRRVIIDLSGVSFVDSRGIGVLAGAVCRIHANGGRVALVTPDTSLSRALATAGFRRLVPLCGSTEEARRWVGEGVTPAL